MITFLAGGFGGTVISGPQASIFGSANTLSCPISVSFGATPSVPVDPMCVVPSTVSVLCPGYYTDAPSDDVLLMPGAFFNGSFFWGNVYMMRGSAATFYYYNNSFYEPGSSISNGWSWWDDYSCASLVLPSYSCPSLPAPNCLNPNSCGSATLSVPQFASSTICAGNNVTMQFTASGLAPLSVVGLVWHDKSSSHMEYLAHTTGVNGANTISFTVPIYSSDWFVSAFSTNPFTIGPPISISTLVQNQISCSFGNIYSNTPFFINANFPVNVTSASLSFANPLLSFAANQTQLAAGYAEWNATFTASLGTTTIVADLRVTSGSCSQTTSCSGVYVDCNPAIPSNAVIINTNTTLSQPSAPLVIASGVSGQRCIAALLFLANSILQ